MKIFLVIPGPPIHPGGPPPEPLRWKLFLRSDHPTSRYGLGVLLTQGRQILDGAMFLHLRKCCGAWIETDDPDRVAAALAVDAGALNGQAN